MTTAKQIQATARNAGEACNDAELLTNDIDQLWDNREATVYTFDDESVLWVSGPTVNAYASREIADLENPAS